MCSYYCPCLVDDVTVWLALTEVELNGFQRTKAAGLEPQDSEGNFRFITTSLAGAVTFKSFEQCINYMYLLADLQVDLPD